MERVVTAVVLAALWAGGCAHPRPPDAPERDPGAVVEGPGRPGCASAEAGGERSDGGPACRGEATDAKVAGAGSQTVGR